MADTVIDFEGMQLIFPDLTPAKPTSTANPNRKDAFYVGQLVNFKLKIPISTMGLEKINSWNVKRSPNYKANAFVREIMSILEIKASLRHSDDYSNRNAVGCTVLNSYDESDSSGKVECSNYGNQEDGPTLTDGHTFIMPLQVRITDVPQNCDRVQLQVEVRTIPKRVPDWLSSPSKTSLDPKQDILESRYCKVEKSLKIIHTPVVIFQQKTIAGKHLIILKVTNTSSCRLWVGDCAVVPEPCPKLTGNQSCAGCKSPTHSHCVVHGNMVKLVTTTQSALPTDLRPGESLSLVYVLHLNSGKDALNKEDISLVAHLKWNVWTRRQKASVTTTYSLPVLKLKQAYFVMSATCDTENVYKGQSDIQHKKPTPGLPGLKIDLEPRCSVECSYGSTIQAQVRFEALSTGIFELCKHMKINLRYAMPGSGPGSQVESPVMPGSGPGSQVESPVNLTKPITADNQVLSASEDLWRDRRGSGSSFNDPDNITATERRLSFANKSYSVGDLAPILSTDSDNASKLKYTCRNTNTSPKQGRQERSRSPASTRYEQMLLNPANFIKNSYKLLVQ